ncbi:MAG: hypothetical protein KGJ49_00835 [Alphaproteobacteria bacterium]|nr:hypothetical protein [Alphaproteobacteria bacterium]
MWRTIAAVLLGLAAWAAAVTILNWGLRLWLPGYGAVEHTMLFTLPMKLARLSIAAAASLAAGAIVRAVAPASRWAPWIVGLVMVALFLPSHVSLWNRFPIWYHLTFLLTLAPLVALGASFLPRGKPAAA